MRAAISLEPTVPAREAAAARAHGRGQRMPVTLATALDGPEAWRALAPGERRVCAALPTRSRRRDFRAGRLAAKRATADLDVALRSAARAEGSCLPETGGAERQRSGPVARVSLAHRDGRALAAAVPPGIDVGVDLERRGAVRPREAAYFLGGKELPLLRRLDATALWVLKEAAWKLLRCDATTPFHALRLRLTPAAAAALARGLPAPLELLLEGRGRCARARLVTPWRGYVGCVMTGHETQGRGS